MTLWLRNLGRTLLGTSAPSSFDTGDLRVFSWGVGWSRAPRCLPLQVCHLAGMGGRLGSAETVITVWWWVFIRWLGAPRESVSRYRK